MLYKDGYKIRNSELIVWKTAFRPETDIITPFVKLYVDGRLAIEIGFMSDGVSFFILSKIKVLIRAGAVHDALYWLMRNGYLSPDDWKMADREFYQVALDAGCFKWVASLILKGLGVAAGYYARPENKRVIHHAP